MCFCNLPVEFFSRIKSVKCGWNEFLLTNIPACLGDCLLYIYERQFPKTPRDPKIYIQFTFNLYMKLKISICYYNDQSLMTITAGAYPGFRIMKRIGVLLYGPSAKRAGHKSTVKNEDIYYISEVNLARGKENKHVSTARTIDQS